MPGELDGGFIASKPMDLEAASQPLDFDLTTSGAPDEPSVAVVDLEFAAFAAGPSEARDEDRVPLRGGAQARSFDMPLDAPAGLRTSNPADAVPERPESGYFDLPPLTGASRAGLAPLPAPGGDQRRSEPPMDLDIPLDDGLTQSASTSGLGAGRGSPAEPGVDLAFDIDLPFGDGSGSRGRSSGAGEEPPGASRRLGPVDPTDFSLGLLDLAPLDQGREPPGRSGAGSESALDLDLPLTPPAPGRR
jgi:hypothetical protein